MPGLVFTWSYAVYNVSFTAHRSRVPLVRVYYLDKRVLRKLIMIITVLRTFQFCDLHIHSGIVDMRCKKSSGPELKVGE